MAVFGLPGGAEWLLIAGAVVLLFVPGMLAFWFGYLTGKNAGTRQATDQGFGAKPVEAPDPSQEDADV